MMTAFAIVGAIILIAACLVTVWVERQLCQLAAMMDKERP